MAVSKTQKRIGIGLAILVAAALILGQCNYNNKLAEDNARLKKNNVALQDTVKFTKNAIGTLTASKKALEVTAKELRKQAWVKDKTLAKLQKEFNEVKSAVHIKSEVRIDSIPVPYKDTIPFVFERQEAVRDKWYSFDLKSNQTGVTINDFKMPNETYVITGMKRDGLFKPSYLTVDVVNTNPYIHTKDITTQVVKIEKPFYDKLWFKFTIFITGLLTGIGISQ